MKNLKKLFSGFFLVPLFIWLTLNPLGCDTQPLLNSQAISAIVEGLRENATTGSDSSLSIIPGGVGFGMKTPAGSGPGRSGGAILHVTTLANSGPGSLREALSTEGPRTVVFDVSGYIPLRKAIEISEPFITIAGQTAPSPGISLKGAGIRVVTHDVLIQHIRIRIGDDLNGPDPSSRDAIAIVQWPEEDNEVYNVVIDHVSASWAIDENLSTWYEGVHDITVTNSIISEGLWESIHPMGPHSKGFLVGNGTHRLSVIGNLFAHNDQRNMFVHGDTSTLFVNNLVYNWYGSSPSGGGSVYGSDQGPYYASIVGNAYVRGRDTRPGTDSVAILLDDPFLDEPYFDRSKIYLKDNQDFSTLDVPFFGPKKGSKKILVQVPPVWIPSLVIKKSEDVKGFVLPHVGARARDRDNVDLRIIKDVKNGTGRIINSQNEVGGWPELAENIRGSEGVPVLSIPSNAIQPSGYTKLEEWLHRLARKLESPS
jgi:hypothetical protein